MEFNLFLQSFESPFLTNFFKFFTFFGSLLFAQIFIATIYIVFNKKYSFIAISSLAISELCTMSLKNIFKIPRPFQKNPQIKKLIEIGGYSFPSGHSTNISAISTSVIEKFFKKWWLYLVFIPLTILVMLSRIYLGVHTIYDCLVGLCIGIVVTLLVSFLLSKLKNFNVLSIVISVISFIVCFIFVKDFLKSTGLAVTVLKYCGSICGFYLGYFLERKFVDFNIEKYAKKERFILTLIQFVLVVPISILLMFFKSNAILWFIRMFIVTIVLTLGSNFVIKIIAKRLNYGKSV